jgi:hypothetical protein
MADNTTLPAGTGGDVISDIDRSLNNPPPRTAKTQIAQLDQGGETGESLVTAANPLNTLDANSGTQQDVLMAILLELRVMNRILVAGLNIPDEVDALRRDEDYGLGAGVPYGPTSN